ncbi:MAG TPA: 2Fe-2S iron-sulfur cluster-binding protein [Burkholderiaceae bacterium]|nr:2Fe-2S iron-sulfur cluster-binding protein [Burkholderiaceae bacterium]
MTAIRFLIRRPDGTTSTREVDAQPGQSVMRAALDAGIEGIVADCGGMLTCATCHVYVASEWIARLPAPTDEEIGMLDFTAADRRDGSRLSCQIQVGPETEGLTVELPDSQY